MGHLCFHYTCNRLRRKQGRKQTQPPNGFIPVFPWALIKTKSTLQHTADAALCRINTVFSPTFFWGGDWSPDWHMLCLGTGRSLAPILCGPQTLLCVASATPPSNFTVLSVPHGAVSNPQTSRRQEWSSPALLSNRKEKDHQQQVGNEFSSGVWVLKRSKTERVKGRKPPKVLKTIFPLPTSRGDDLFPNDQRSKHSSHTSAYKLEETG